MQQVTHKELSGSGLHVWRGDRHVLRGLTLRLQPGEILHATGPNGSGKTTLMRVLAGLLAAEQGEVHWGGQSIDKDRDGYASALCYLAHDNALKADLTAHENLAFATGLRHPVDAAEIDAALGTVGVARCRDLPARVLSAGQRRRVAFARALLAAAPLWLLDEPFTNLDADGITAVSALLAAHAAGGGLVLLAAHQAPPMPGHPMRRLELA